MKSVPSTEADGAGGDFHLKTVSQVGVVMYASDLRETADLRPA